MNFRRVMNIHTLNPIRHYRLKSMHLRCNLANYVLHFSLKKILLPLKHRPSYGLVLSKTLGTFISLNKVDPNISIRHHTVHVKARRQEKSFRRYSVT